MNYGAAAALSRTTLRTIQSFQHCMYTRWKLDSLIPAWLPSPEDERSRADLIHLPQEPMGVSRRPTRA
eukprot:2837531-Pyramimonas_sp.AAC.1